MSGRYGLNIRTATPADASGLCELMNSCGLSVTPERMAARLEHLVSAGSAAALIAVEWGPPGGLAVVNWTRGLHADGGVAHLDTLLVAPDDRRRGLGRLLLKAASQSARLAGCDDLLVSGNAPSLLAFLAATGFTAGPSAYARPLRRRA